MSRDWSIDPPNSAKELGEALADKCMELIKVDRRATIERIRARLEWGHLSDTDRATFERFLDEEAR